MNSLDRYALGKLEGLESAALRRRLVTTDRAAFPWVVQNGSRLLSFSCNDYLGLSVHPRVKAAATKAVARYGTGAGASRLVTGNPGLYDELEARLAAMKKTDAACVFGSGYLANVGVIGALAGPGDLILLDALSHACIHAGGRLSQAEVKIFGHNDVAAAKALLAAHRGQFARCLLVTETVFSMDGDRAPLDELAAACETYDAWLMSDDAHGFGMQGLGMQALGMEAPEGTARIPLQMGTLSKALGSYGGYLCASHPVIDLVKTRARSLIYSTGLPPATLAAALAALDVIAEEPGLGAEPLRKARLLTSRLGLAPAVSPIVPLVIGTPEAALQASARLARAGFLVTAIRPPTVPPGTARLRFAFSALHEDRDIERLAAAVAGELGALALSGAPA